MVDLSNADAEFARKLQEEEYHGATLDEDLAQLVAERDTPVRISGTPPALRRSGNIYPVQETFTTTTSSTTIPSYGIPAIPTSPPSSGDDDEVEAKLLEYALQMSQVGAEETSSAPSPVRPFVSQELQEISDREMALRLSESERRGSPNDSPHYSPVTPPRRPRYPPEYSFARIPMPSYLPRYAEEDYGNYTHPSLVPGPTSRERVQQLSRQRIVQHELLRQLLEHGDLVAQQPEFEFQHEPPSDPFLAQLEQNEGELSYEEMIRLEEALPPVSKGAKKEDINSLPVSVHTGDSKDKSCPVCLCEYEKGQMLRTLPCLHRFHVECIDPWLEMNKICPTCRCEIRQ